MMEPSKHPELVAMSTMCCGREGEGLAGVKGYQTSYPYLFSLTGAIEGHSHDKDGHTVLWGAVILQHR